MRSEKSGSPELNEASKADPTGGDVSERRRTELALIGQNRVLERIAKGSPLTDTLEEVVRLVEAQLPGSRCSVYVRDPGASHLRFVAGQSLPESMRRDLAIVPIGPSAGSCGTAAFRKQPVRCLDIATDPLWPRWRHVPLAHGLGSCVSAPILAHGGLSGEEAGSVLGTVALYTPRDTPPDAHLMELLIGSSGSTFEGASGEGDDREPRSLDIAKATSVGLGTAHLAGVAIERERAELALRESEERYRRMVEVLPAALFLETDDVITLCNTALVQMLGYRDAKEVTGQSPFTFIPAEDHALVRERRRQMLATGERTDNIEGRMIRPDGGQVQVSVVATPITDRGKTSFLVAMIDMSERRRADERLRSVLASVFDAVITVDHRGRVVSVNAATERMFGIRAADLVGESVSRLVPPAHAGRHDGYIEGYLRGAPSKVVGRTLEMMFHRKDGGSFPGEITVSPFQIGQEAYFVAVVRDLTERKRLEEQYRQSQKMEAVGQLAGGVAHDFNNLLTIISGYTEMLLADLAEGAQEREAVTAIHEAAGRAAGLTAQLLAFSRKAIVSPKVLHLNDVITSFSRMLRRLIGEDIRLVLDLASTLPHVYIDPSQIEQVLMNLAVNARDAMPTGGRLMIATSVAACPPPVLVEGKEPPPGPYVLLTVQDTGCGMSDEIKAHIFEPFFTTKGPGRGTGLGLATLYGVVRQAGGIVTVDSAPGLGTTFRVHLPLAPSPKVGPAGAKGPVARGGSETILVVEDEEALRRLVHRVLAGAGYTVIDTPSGEEALRLAATHEGPIHLLVTDVVMPEMGGRAVADAIRAARPETRVIYMSGYTDDAIVRHGIEAAHDAFLRKPFSPAELKQKVREALEPRADHHRVER